MTNNAEGNASLKDRVLHYRAMEALVWAMPILNATQFREGHKDCGVEYNDVAYNSKVQNWKFQTQTPNDTTPYVNFFWNVEDGPVVIEIPASGDGVGIFGTLMDAWQRPIEDVGAKGKDGGNGAKYVLLPPNYDGSLIPGAYTYPQRTNNGFAILRTIIPDSSPESLKKSEAFAKQINIYPLKQAANPPKTRYVDIYDKLMEGTVAMDETIFAKLNAIIQGEVIEAENRAMMGLLNQIGIRKGKSFDPDAATNAIFAAAAPDALNFMIEQYHRYLNPSMYDDKKWTTLTPPGVFETGFTYEFPAYYDYHARGVLYYAIISGVKTYGTATFYLSGAQTAEGEWLDGDKNYMLVVPPNVPVRDFWAVTVYDLESAAWIRDMSKVGIDSTRKDLAKNADGSVNVYFGPEAPEGMASNWIPTRVGKRFFLLFRFYGPETAVFDKSWQLDDIKSTD